MKRVRPSGGSDCGALGSRQLSRSDRPQARMLSLVAAPQAVSQSYTPPELAKIYAFPEEADGTGQTIAVIELGGGFDQADLDTYFTGLGLTGADGHGRGR